MCFLSMYLCMLFSNWTVLSIKTDENSTLNWSTFYIKSLVMIFTNTLYLYILIAPKLLPNRRII